MKKKDKHYDCVSSILILFFFFFPVFVCFSISGENKHYESPTNPAAHDRIPGGACSGAAVAVATNAVDFALGEFSIYFFSLLGEMLCKIDQSFVNKTCWHLYTSRKTLKRS